MGSVNNFYPISTWPPSIKEIIEHNPITDKNTFKLIFFAYGNGISPNVFIEYLYKFILNTSSKTKKHLWFINLSMIFYSLLSFLGHYDFLII